jgi:hypothetical protein
VEVLCINYDQLNEVLGQSPATREALHQSANEHEAENAARRSAGSLPGREATS